MMTNVMVLFEVMSYLSTARLAGNANRLISCITNLHAQVNNCAIAAMQAVN